MTSPTCTARVYDTDTRAAASAVWRGLWLLALWRGLWLLACCGVGCDCSRTVAWAVAARVLWLLACCGCLRCGCSRALAGRDDRCRTQARIAVAAHGEADPVHFLERSLAPEPEDRVTAAEESLAHPSFSCAGAGYVHACSGSLPNVFFRAGGLSGACVRGRSHTFHGSGGRALRCVRGRSHTLRGSERIDRFAVLYHPPLGAERRSLNQGALYAAGLTLSVAPISGFIRGMFRSFRFFEHSPWLRLLNSFERSQKPLAQMDTVRQSMRHLSKLIFVVRS